MQIIPPALYLDVVQYLVKLHRLIRESPELTDHSLPLIGLGLYHIRALYLARES